TLAAVLLATEAGQKAAAGALPSVLVGSAARVAVNAARSVGGVPESVAALADCGARALTAPQPKVVAACVLLLALPTWGVGPSLLPAGTGRPAGAAPETAQEKPNEQLKAPPQKQPAVKKEMLVTGSVLDPRGKPLPSAEVVLMA